MKTVIKKLTRFAVKSAILAAATKGVVSIAKKFNNKDTEEKINDLIDDKTEKARLAAKDGVQKAFTKLDEIVDKADELEVKGKELKGDLSTKSKEIKEDVIAKVTAING